MNTAAVIYRQQQLTGTHNHTQTQLPTTYSRCSQPNPDKPRHVRNRTAKPNQTNGEWCENQILTKKLDQIGLNSTKKLPQEKDRWTKTVDQNRPTNTTQGIVDDWDYRSGGEGMGPETNKSKTFPDLFRRLF